jgi:DNA polymerase III subunit gamma/tau
MVFYRKYRPQTLEELVGQTAVKTALKSAISAQKLAHAYLFFGPRGTGKTTTARILAKMVNCAGQESDDKSQEKKIPCNQCSFCTTITEGSNMDVIEMDAASNRGIDDIRALRENIKLAPTSAKKKVYIIDEVHMLSGDAFNALLKTLEEPPEHVLFILATTEIQKVPQTILSRVQRLDFKLATTEELTEALNRIAESEKIEIDQEALLALAKKANGSFRDGVKLLDQMSALGKIDRKTVEENLGGGVWEGQIQLLELIAVKDAEAALKKLVGMTETGVNFKELTLSLLDLLRQLMLIKNNLGLQLVKPEAGEEKYPLIEKLGEKFELGHLLRVINHLQTSLEQGRFVSLPSLPLELAVVESCMEAGSQKSETRSRETDKPEPESQKPEERNQKPEVGSQEPEEENLVSEVTVIAEASTASISSDIQKIQDRWSYILETVRQYNYSLEALLRSARIINCEGVNVTVEVPYSFHQRMLEAPKSRDLLESIFSDILGRSVKISTVLGQKPTRTEDIANVEVAPDDDIVRMAAEIFGSN